ncbi:MAG: ribonuclease [Lachnospiraceae bacterium]|nr:ribonuclease [Lachnospiraceae bacterium]
MNQDEGVGNSINFDEIEVVSLEAQVIAIPQPLEATVSTVTDATVSEIAVDSIDAKAASQTEDSQSDEEWLVELPQQGYSYYDLDNVVLYLYLYEELPDNYITKSEAKKLGWEGGSVEKYQKGAAIGGDRFGNKEGLLPEADGRTYTECDIDTDGEDSRGAKRLVFSNDGLYFYTEDHYESFEEVTVTERYEVVR